jgi:hypothetical protein
VAGRLGQQSVLSECCLSSVTFVNCGQTVWDRPMVTMRHYWEVDIGLSESANKFDLGWPWRGHFKVMKVKMARIVWTVDRWPRVPIDKKCSPCPASKSAPWPLTLIDLQGSFQGHVCENRTWRLPGERWIHACYWTPNFIRLLLLLLYHIYNAHNVKATQLM